MKSAHQLARELLAGPDLPIWHFDPSRAGLDEDCTTSLSVPEVQENDPLDGHDEESIADFKAQGFVGKFLTLGGETDDEGEAEEAPAEPDLRDTLRRMMNPPADCPHVSAWAMEVLEFDYGRFAARRAAIKHAREALINYFLTAEIKELRKQLQQHKICPPAGTPGVALIASERNRQIADEKFTFVDDDYAIEEQLAAAAACYAMPESFRHKMRARSYTLLAELWPWGVKWWKPSTDRIRDLQKAGALLAAEIDRLLRRKTPHESRD